MAARLFRKCGERAALARHDAVAVELCGELDGTLDEHDDARLALLLAFADADDSGPGEELAAVGGQHLA